jgi:hypothetical protein
MPAVHKRLGACAMLVQLGRHLRSKRNFVMFFVVAAGVPSAVVLVSWFGRYGDMWFRLLIIVLAIGGGAVTGLIMWEYFKWLFPSLREEQKSKGPDSSKS